MSIALRRVTDLQGWADRIRTHWDEGCGQAVAAWIDAGCALADAKKALKHGEWERLFADHKQAIKNPLPFSVGTATRLMKIAAHPTLSKAAHVPSLPPSWGTLYELTKLPEPTLKKALGNGSIRPDMERREVAALRGDAPTKPTAWDFAEASERLRRLVQSELARGGERQSLVYALKQLIKLLEAEMTE